MKRTAQIYALVLVVLLAASWRQWTAEESVDLEGKVVMLQGEADDVEQVRWISTDSEATVTRKKDARGEYFWVDYTRWTEKKLPAARAKTEDSDTGNEPDEAPVREAKRSAFKSAQKAFDLMTSLSPMAARRSLQVTDDEKLAEIGLLEPTSSIEIVRSGRTQKLDVGGEAVSYTHLTLPTKRIV